jgi:Kef-type K+ transport system membrane component KefB
LACGSALASTGIGFTLTLMKDLDLLVTPLGQLVAAAAMIDDVSSMVLLAILQGATSIVETGEADAMAMVKPVLASLGLFAASIVLRMIAARHWPLVKSRTPRQSSRKQPCTCMRRSLAL